MTSSGAQDNLKTSPKKRRPSWFSSGDGGSDVVKSPQVGPSERIRRRRSLAEMVGIVMTSGAASPVGSPAPSQRTGLQRNRYGGRAARRTQQLKTEGTGAEHSPRSPRRSRSRTRSKQGSSRGTSPSSTPRTTPVSTPGGSPLSSPPALALVGHLQHNSILSPPRMAVLDTDIEVQLRLPARALSGNGRGDDAAVSPPPPIVTEHLISEAREGGDGAIYRGPQRAKPRATLHDSLFDAALCTSPLVSNAITQGRSRGET